MVKLTGKKLRSYVAWHQSRGVSWLIASGFRRFRNEFLPAVAELERTAQTRSDRILLSDTWYVIGDIHDFNQAPRAALRAYRRSIRWDPSNAGAHRELGGMLENIGQYASGVRALERAVELWPEDGFSRIDLESARTNASAHLPPLYRSSDWTWHVRELIAAGRFKQAISAIGNRKSVLAHQYLACCHGALNNPDGVVHEWKTIARLNGSIALEHVDWFYAADAAFDRADFWQALLDCGNRFWHKDAGSPSYGIWIVLPSPYESTVVTNREWNSPKYRKWVETKRRLHCQFHLARTLPDPALASKIAKRFPKWRKAVTLSKRLNNTAQRAIR